MSTVDLTPAESRLASSGSLFSSVRKVVRFCLFSAVVSFCSFLMVSMAVCWASLASPEVVAALIAAVPVS